MKERIIPDIPRIKAHWDTSNPVPYLRVPCSDRQVRTFVELVNQPAPYIVTGERLAEMIRNNTYGGYSAKHNKK